MADQKAMDRREAVAYLKDKGLITTHGTMQKWASTGGGPVFRKFGHRVVYFPTDLDNWIASRLSPPVRSTSELKKSSRSSNSDAA